MVMRAMAIALGIELEVLRKAYKEIGDLGLVAVQLKANSSKRKNDINNSILSVRNVFDSLMEIAKESGQGSQERKITGLAGLLEILSAEEVKYVVRIVLGRLRLGFSDKTILDALSVMVVSSKASTPQLEQAYQVLPDVGMIARMVKEGGVVGLEKRVEVTLGIPVMPALCQRLKSAEEMIQKMNEVVVEPKFDGTRVQIHFSRKSASEVTSDKQQATNKEAFLRTFTRNLDETTAMFPELVSGIDQIQADSVILDTEAIGVHPVTGKLLPFQETITRKRKHGIQEASRQVPLKFFVFDLLYCDGESLLHRPLIERKKILSQMVKRGSVLELSPMIRTKEPQTLRDFHKEQLALGFEGAVIKQVDGEYIPGRRGWNWVKFKEVEEAKGKLADTVDVVVMGWYRGKGKRTRFGIGAFLVGVRRGEEIVTIAKIGTGLSDEQWQELRRKLETEISVETPKAYQVETQLIPDVWVDPVVVVEVAADEITTSPSHTAGLALRFPRLVKFRDDKSLSQITSLEELKHLRTL
jgi:DNA ligase-1